MKRFILLLFITFSCSAIIQAQLLWEISGKGIEKPSYLLGTHHIAPTSVLDSVIGFKEAFATTDKVYGEIIISKDVAQQLQMGLVKYGAAPQDSTLSALLSPAQIDSLDKVLKSYMGPMGTAAQFNLLKPVMASTTLALLQSQKAFPNFNPGQQLDGAIQDMAIAAGKEVGAFETIDDQCRAMFGGSILSQAQDLMDMVRNDNNAVETAQSLANAYLAGDLNTMLTIIEDSSSANSEEWKERMINKRNANWLRIIAGLLPSASIFIAVGAGHLPGDKGLISLLRKEGYSVSPVNSKH